MRPPALPFLAFTLLVAIALMRSSGIEGPELVLPVDAAHSTRPVAHVSPSELSTDELIAMFDADRAMAHLRHLSDNIGPRPFGSPEETAAADYMEADLNGWGWDTVRQGDIPLAGTDLKTANIVATHPTDRKRGVVVVGAHYDSSALRQQSPGANDNASGVAVLLEVARVMRHTSLPYELRVVCFGGEERTRARPDMAKIGSAYYVEQLTEDERGDILAMLNLDMVGAGKPLTAVRAGHGSDVARQALLSSADRLGLHLVTETGNSRSDHAAFERADIPAVWLTRMRGYPYRHTVEDRSSRISRHAMIESGRLTIRFLLTLAENRDGPGQPFTARREAAGSTRRRADGSVAQAPGRTQQR